MTSEGADEFGEELRREAELSPEEIARNGQDAQESGDWNWGPDIALARPTASHSPARGSESQNLEVERMQAQLREAQLQAQIAEQKLRVVEAERKYAELKSAAAGSETGTPYRSQLRDSTFEALSPDTAAGADEAAKSSRATEKMLETAAGFRRSLGRYDQNALQAKYARLAGVLPKLNARQTTVMPTILSYSELEKLEEKVRKIASTQCSGKTKQIHSESSLIELTLGILEEARADRTILMRTLKEENFDDFSAAYAKEYDEIRETCMSQKQLAEMNLEQWKERSIGQDDRLIIAIVEDGFCKLAPALATRIKQKAGGEGKSRKHSLSDLKQHRGAGILYLLEAIAEICQSSWETTRLALQDVLDLPHVLEQACNGSVVRIQEEARRWLDEFETRNGAITRDMIEGFILLTVIENFKQDHLKALLKQGSYQHKYEVTERDLDGAIREAKKAIEYIGAEELRHADKSVREKHTMPVRDIRAALKKHRESSSTSGSAHVAAADKARNEGYHKGVVTGAGALLMDKTSAAKAMAVTYQESKKKLTDEAQTLGNLMQRVYDKVSKIEDGGELSERDLEAVKNLAQQFKQLNSRLDEGTQSKKKDQRGRSKEPRDAGADPKPRTCIFWKQGDCSKGKDCRFGHPPKEKGCDPDAQFISRRRSSERTNTAAAAGGRGRSREREKDNNPPASTEDDREKDAPNCKNPKCGEKAARKQGTSEFWDYCKRGCMIEHKQSEDSTAMASMREITASTASEAQDDQAIREADIERHRAIARRCGATHFASSFALGENTHMAYSGAAIRIAGSDKPGTPVVQQGEPTIRGDSVIRSDSVADSQRSDSTDDDGKCAECDTTAGTRCEACTLLRHARTAKSITSTPETSQLDPPATTGASGAGKCDSGNGSSCDTLTAIRQSGTGKCDCAKMPAAGARCVECRDIEPSKGRKKVSPSKARRVRAWKERRLKQKERAKKLMMKVQLDQKSRIMKSTIQTLMRYACAIAEYKRKGVDPERAMLEKLKEKKIAGLHRKRRGPLKTQTIKETHKKIAREKQTRLLLKKGNPIRKKKRSQQRDAARMRCIKETVGLATAENQTTADESHIHDDQGNNATASVPRETERNAMRTYLMFARQARWKRSTRAYVWGSEMEIEAALDSLVKQNAVVPENERDDVDAEAQTDSEAHRGEIKIDWEEEMRDLDEILDQMIEEPKAYAGMTDADGSGNDDEAVPTLIRSSSSDDDEEEDETDNIAMDEEVSIYVSTPGEKVKSEIRAKRRRGRTDERKVGGVGGVDMGDEDNSAGSIDWDEELRLIEQICGETDNGVGDRMEPPTFERGTRKTACVGNGAPAPKERQFAPDPGSIYMRVSSLITRLIDFDVEKQEYISAPAFEDAVEFLKCYKVRAHPTKGGVRLALFDTGSTCLISPFKQHFPIRRKTSMQINGIGGRAAPSCEAPQFISVLDVNARKYINLIFDRGYFHPEIGFVIIPSGPLEKSGYRFYVRHVNPYFVAPDGSRGHLIKDYYTGLTWIAERPQAGPAVTYRRALVEDARAGFFQQAEIDDSAIGEIEEMPVRPDSKENIDRELANIAAQSMEIVSPGYHQGGQAFSSEASSKQEGDEISDGDGIDDGEATNAPTRCFVEEKTQKYLAQAEIKAAKRPKPVHIRLPTQRLLNTGDSERCIEFLEYWHALAGHLEWNTILEALDFIEGGDLVKAIQTIRRQRGTHECKTHCDACARMKARPNPVPKKRTTRPTREQPPDKIELDASGMIDTPSVYHNFIYYLLGTTEIGFLLVEFMSFKSQTLLQTAKMFAQVGGPPKRVGVDAAGEYKSANAARYFAHHQIAVDDSVGGEHWRQGGTERGHGQIKTMTRCSLAHANAPREFWSFALRHMVLTANLFLRAKDSKTRQKQEMTLWEAHYGEKPDVRRYLPGPWGCLAYITLTHEARMARGIDKAFGPRAVGGIFLGTYVNPRTNIYHFMIHDGQNIVSTSSDLRVVGDCFPFRWQRGRDVTLRLRAPDEDEDDLADDDLADSGETSEEIERTNKGKLVWVKIPTFPTWPCLLWPDRDIPEDQRSGVTRAKPANGILVYTLGDHKFYWAKSAQVSAWGGKGHDDFWKQAPPGKTRAKFWSDFSNAKKEAEAELKIPGTTWPQQCSAAASHVCVDERRGPAREYIEQAVTRERDRYMRALQRELNFVCSSTGIDAASKMLRSNQDHIAQAYPVKEKTRSRDERRVPRLHRSIIEHAAQGPIDVEQYLKEIEDSSASVEHENPLDFDVKPAPDDFEVETPYDGARYQVLQPIDFTDDSKVDRKLQHPGHQLVGRRVRKTIVKGRGRRDHTIEGVISRYIEKRALFQIKYNDNAVEYLDLVNLKQILVLDKKRGDPAEHHGRTTQELSAAAFEHTLCAEIWDEYVSNRIPTAYGEGESHTSRSLMASPQQRKSCLRKEKGRHNAQHKVKHARILCEDGVGRKTGNEEGEPMSRSATVVHTAAECNEALGYRVDSEEEIAQKRAERTKEKEAGMYQEAAFFVPQACATTANEGKDNAEREEVPRDDEPKNKKEADNHRCPKCRLNSTISEPCEKCFQERKGIFECWVKEMEQLKDKQVFHEITDSEFEKIKKEGHKILSAKMVTKRKYEAVRGQDGMMRDRFLKWKGRLACVGTREVKGVDMPWSTFSPVIGLTAVRTVISMMCREDFVVNAYDLSGAFLAAELDRPVYMKLPAECGDLAGKVVKLSKAIYGLKTSSRDYVQAFSEKILEFEHDGCKFERLCMDACIFRFRGRNGEEIILCHYVDDLIVGTNSVAIREKLLTHIREKWDVTDEGVMTRFVGLNFGRSANGKTWDLSCAPYIERVASRFGADDGRYHDTPMDAGFVVTPEDLEEEATPEMLAEYRSLIGSIGFAAVTVRYDIAYAVSVLSRYIMKPNQKVINAAMRVVRYLMKTRDFKITWSTEKENINPEKINKIWGAVDASFASDPITRRSHSGYLIFNNGGCISWKSGLQKIVTLSSCESEFVGLCSGIVEICYLRQLMAELGCPQSEGTLLYEDNKACIILAEGETSSGGRSKHIDVKFRYIAENVKKGLVRIRYIPTAWNYADIMTKPLGKIQYARILDLCVAPEQHGLKDSEERVEEETEECALIFDYA